MPIDIEKDDVKTALKKLKARETTLRKLEMVSKLGSWEVDLKTNKSTWSDRSYDIYGIDKNTNITIETFFSLLLPEYIKTAKDTLDLAIKTAQPVTLSCKAKRIDDKIISLLINGQVIYDENNTPLKLIGTTQDITEITALKEQTKELSELIEHSSNEIYIVDLETLEYLYANKGACDALGYTKEELLGMNVRNINPYLKDSEILRLKKLLLNTQHVLNRTIHQRKDGSFYHVQSYIHTLEYHNKPAYVIFDTDISQIVDLEIKHKKQSNILEHIHDSVIATDIYGNITNWNNGSKNLFGYEADEIIGKSIKKLYSQENTQTIDELLSTLDIQHRLSIEAFMNKKDGTKIICDMSLSTLKNGHNSIDGYVGYVQDVTKQKETQELLREQTKKLKHQAHHDMLTDLPNRTLFKDRLHQSIIISKRNSEKFALLFIDLDQFKKINDSLGHHIGDEVLIEVAKRLTNAIREEDTLARLGGDEFTIILKDVKNIQSASTVAQKIIEIIKEPILISSHTLYISSSIGISMYPDDSTNDDNLIKYADAAMYKAKDEGRDNYQFYSSEMTAFAFERVVIESSLKMAIKEEQFEVYFQPQFKATSNKIIGMEALVRWIHPSIGPVSPEKFIPIAEESGLIIEIDNIVMKKAMTQFAKWHSDGLNPGILALNLAMKQLNDKDFIVKLLNTMNITKFKPQWLELEVTEGQVMNNPESSIKKLNKISTMGIEIAIDDFGTGYSSLSYLKKLPLDKLKIDQSFMREIPYNEDDVAITKAIIALGKSLNLKIMAEGVEKKEQKDFLISNGCDYIQGYYYCKPIPAKDITQMLEEIKGI
jgi:diguanylate cyclase (GGDEF)-like protein/PAS domain S-box-containing protein